MTTTTTMSTSNLYRLPHIPFVYWIDAAEDARMQFVFRGDRIGVSSIERGVLENICVTFSEDVP